MNMGAAQNFNVSDAVVNRILARLKQEQPAMYSRLVARYKPQKQLAGLGDLMSDFSDAFKGVLDTASTLYLTKEQSKIASDNAKSIAQQEIAKGQQQLDLMRINAQGQYNQMQFAAEQQRLAQMQQEIDSGDRNKMLLLAAGGLGLVLAFSMMSGKGR